MFGLIAVGLAVGTVLAGPLPDPASSVSPCSYTVELRNPSFTLPMSWPRNLGAHRDIEGLRDVARSRARAVPPAACLRVSGAAKTANKPANSGSATSDAGKPSAGKRSLAKSSSGKSGGKSGTAGKKGSRKRRPGHIAAEAALRWLGTPYSWGGGSASGPTRGIGRGARTVGFDCSGLTLHAWAKAGVRLGHYTGAQFRQGRRVRRPRRGDLVFFGGGGGDPTHVGLYLSRGVMVHAPKTGDVVKKTRFSRSVARTADLTRVGAS